MAPAGFALWSGTSFAAPAFLGHCLQRHLAGHPELAGQIDTVISRTDQVRRRIQQRRDRGAP